MPNSNEKFQMTDREELLRYFRGVQVMVQKDTTMPDFLVQFEGRFLGLVIEALDQPGTTALISRVEALEGAIRWALGEGDSNFKPREDGQGPYWWRKELRKRAAMEPLTNKEQGE